MSDGRRGFFKKAAGAAVGLASVEAVLEATGGTPKAAAADRRSFAAGRFALELDGAAAFVQSFEGGAAHSAVVEETPGPDACFAAKHLAVLEYEEIAVTCGTGMTAGFYAWLQSSLGCQSVRKDGAIVGTDFRSAERSRLTFTQALVTEFGMPALDAASKDAAKMTLKFAPEVTRRVAGSGQAVRPCGEARIQKKWLSSNFRLTIDGLDCTKVSTVEALTIKQKVVENQVGEPRDPGAQQRKIEFPNLVVTLAEAHAQSFFDWHEDFVVKGHNASEDEKNGKLEYLAPNLADVLFTLEFHNLGIFKLASETPDSGDQIQRVKAEMYCQQMTFTPGTGVGC